MLGSVSLIRAAAASMSGSMRLSTQGYVTRFNPRNPTAPIRAWEMCPPSAVETAVMVSPGFARALRPAMLETVPEVDWMLAKLQPKTRCAEAMPISSMVSKSSQPW